MKKEKETKPKNCYALFINLASQFISFKISKGRSLGRFDTITKINPKFDIVFEDEFDTVDYLSSDDIFDTETDALKGLVKILNERIKNDEI